MLIPEGLFSSAPPSASIVRGPDKHPLPVPKRKKPSHLSDEKASCQRAKQQIEDRIPFAENQVIISELSHRRNLREAFSQVTLVDSRHSILPPEQHIRRSSVFCQTPVRPATKARLRRAFELSVIHSPWIMDNQSPSRFAGRALLLCRTPPPQQLSVKLPL